jgi:hypothetical protein
MAALLLLTAMSMASPIYRTGHFNLVTELTTDNFEETVRTNVDGGKTLFVRWIASQG